MSTMHVRVDGAEVLVIDELADGRRIELLALAAVDARQLAADLLAAADEASRIEATQ